MVSSPLQMKLSLWINKNGASVKLAPNLMHLSRKLTGNDTRSKLYAKDKPNGSNILQHEIHSFP